jgi:hypothetical protein
MDELVENLHRNELTPAEKEAHQTAYAGLLKKLHKVSSAKKNRSKNAKNRFTKDATRDDIGDPQAVGHLSGNGTQTVAEKIAADTGVRISWQAHRR